MEYIDNHLDQNLKLLTLKNFNLFERKIIGFVFWIKKMSTFKENLKNLYKTNDTIDFEKLKKTKNFTEIDLSNHSSSCNLIHDNLNKIILSNKKIKVLNLSKTGIIFFF
jgi:hypothetical protein